MSYFFLFFIFVGVVQLVLQSKRPVPGEEYIASAANKKTENTHFLFERLRAFQSIVKDVFRDTFGIEKSEKIRNGIIFTVAIIAAMFANQLYNIFSWIVALCASVIIITNVMYIRNKKARKTQFEIEFLEALNIVNSVIISGNGILHAIEVCGEKVDGVVGREFSLISQKLSYGDDPRNAFMQSYEKMPYKEYYFFVTVILNNLSTGGQLKKAMSNIISTITNSRTTEKKKVAKTAEVRTSIKVLSAIPCLFLVFLKSQNPEGFRILTEDPIGQILFYYAIGSVVIGVIILWSMMNKI